MKTLFVIILAVVLGAYFLQNPASWEAVTGSVSGIVEKFSSSYNNPISQEGVEAVKKVGQEVSPYAEKALGGAVKIIKQNLQ